MTKIFFHALIALIFFSCETQYEYWNISKFNMDETALKNEEEVKIIYTSRGPDYNQDLKYYVHLIAISQESGDTVNILSTGVHGLTKKDEHKVFNYFNENSLVSKLNQMNSDELNNIESFDKIKNIEPKIEYQLINKVARDPKFDDIADNNYPTVIGLIGTVSMIEE
ncbi:hypothetical protein [Brumimicrobium mesophilum]|uniref:hypothetical protein n=1 Tax=Brumimicrobium mesophilum TaxID=392717 RepID=UPI000D13F9BE|nr:hypothetical protein [Brumimicrobium mesophilum]